MTGIVWRLKWGCLKGTKQRIQGIGSIKDEKSRSFNAFWSLEVKKSFLPVPKLSGTEAQGLEGLSRQMVKLLRWDLPSSGMTYNKNDGPSVSLTWLYVFTPRLVIWSRPLLKMPAGENCV